MYCTNYSQRITRKCYESVYTGSVSSFLNSDVTMIVTREWFDKARRLSPGERLFIPAASKRDQKLISRMILKEKDSLSEIDPALAMALMVGMVMLEGKLWVTISKKSDSPMVGMIITDGKEVEKVWITDSKKRTRVLKAMKSDGMMVEEPEEIIGKLTEEERELWR
jgi:hypothetical protein